LVCARFIALVLGDCKSAVVAFAIVGIVLLALVPAKHPVEKAAAVTV
jgi:hypothetical protein